MNDGRRDYWFRIAMNQTGITVPDVAALVKVFPELAAEAERIEREVPDSQQRAWAFIGAIQRARDIANHLKTETE